MKFFETVALFEIGSVFYKKTNYEPAEEVRCCIALAGKGMDEQECFRRVRGAVEETLKRVGVTDYTLTEENKTLSIVVDSETIGIISRANTGHTETYAEFSLTKLLPFVSREKYFTPIPKYPSIIRDISFVVLKSVKTGALIDAAWHDAPHDLVEIRFIGIYEGKGIPEGKKSITLRFIFQSLDRTLTDKEIDTFSSYMQDAIQEIIAFEIK